MQNYLFGVAYNGTNYAGWQKQNNALGIQEVIETALEELLGKKIEIYASGRTDAGVHAYEQCFNAKFNFSDYTKLPIAINSKLPEDIRILWVKKVNNDFHSRFSAHKKTYIYRIKTSFIESPFDSFITTYLNYKLDYNKMIEASKLFIGEHDFQSFCSSNTTTPDYIRTIYNFNIKNDGDLYEFEICGNGFLYNMVRIIVGTIVDVGRGKLSIKELKEVFDKHNRVYAGKTMPAKALILKSVEY